MKFYTLGLIITIVINAHGYKHAQLLAEHKYLHIELQVCVCTCIPVHAGEERWCLFCLVHFQKDLHDKTLFPRVRSSSV